MRTPTDTANDYLAVWNAASRADRLKLLEGWSADARYCDPLMQAEGRDAIADMIESAMAQFAGHAFALQGTPDGHGPFVRFSWTLAPEHGGAVAAGTDIVRLDGNGRVAEVIGFLDGGQA